MVGEVTNVVQDSGAPFPVLLDGYMLETFAALKHYRKRIAVPFFLRHSYLDVSFFRIQFALKAYDRGIQSIVPVLPLQFQSHFVRLEAFFQIRQHFTDDLFQPKTFQVMGSSGKIGKGSENSQFVGQSLKFRFPGLTIQFPIQPAFLGFEYAHSFRAQGKPGARGKFAMLDVGITVVRVGAFRTEHAGPIGVEERGHSET